MSIIQPLVESDPIVETVVGLDEAPEETTIDVVYTSDTVMRDAAGDRIGIQLNDTSTGKTHTLTLKQLKHSGFLSTVANEDKDAKVISVPASSMTEYAFDKCIEYLKHHQNDEEIKLPEKPLKSTDLKQVWTDTWDVDFIEQVFTDSEGCDKLYAVILAANYLDMPGCIHLGCTKLAAIIKGKKLEELDEFLGLTPEAESEEADDDANEEASEEKKENDA